MINGTELNFDWSTLLSATGGGSIAIAICRATIAKALRDLHDVTQKVNDTLINLSAINIKLAEIDKLSALITIHDRAIQRLEAKLEHEQQIRLYKANTERELDSKD